MPPWKPRPFRSPVDVHQLAGLEEVDRERLADLVAIDRLEPHFAQDPHRRPTPAFLKWPAMGFRTFLRFGSKPSWSASYPSVARLFTWTTVQGPTSSTVTGTLFPSSANTCVMPRLRRDQSLLHCLGHGVSVPSG